MDAEESISRERDATSPLPIIGPVLAGPATRSPRLRLPPLRLRHKLGVSLVITALLPVLVASWVAVSVVLADARPGPARAGRRKLHVGLNLLLHQVELTGRGGESPGRGPGARRRDPARRGRDRPRPGPPGAARSARCSSRSPTRTAVIRARRVAGDAVGRFDGIGVQASSPVLEAGRDYERRVSISAVADQLVVRAAAPLVDRSLQPSRRGGASRCRSTADLAEQVKARSAPTSSSSLARAGHHRHVRPRAIRLGAPRTALPADVAEAMRRSRSVLRTRQIGDRAVRGRLRAHQDAGRPDRRRVRGRGRPRDRWCGPRHGDPLARAGRGRRVRVRARPGRPPVAPADPADRPPAPGRPGGGARRSRPPHRGRTAATRSATWRPRSPT